MGQSTGKYRLGQRIGGGGMAEVFEATLVGAEGFSRPVAIKRIQPVLSADQAFGQMFVNEARIASLLHHANIVSVLDFDRDDEERYFLVMELIQGVDLRQLMDGGPVPAHVAVHIVAEILRGLDYAHELEHDGRHLGIVHRDISPHNVMLSWDGAVKLVDFGIAKAVAATGISRAGTIKGKLSYMSPEQAGAEPLDGRSDLFAVGIVLHELLVGDRLFVGNSEPEVLARVLSQPIPRPSERIAGIPAQLDAVVMKLLERDRDLRYVSAHAALDGLLSTPAATSRGAMDLENLLVERFPDQARRRRGSRVGTRNGITTPVDIGSERTTPAKLSAATPVLKSDPSAPTLAERPPARAPIQATRTAPPYRAPVTPLPVVPTRRRLVPAIAVIATVAVLTTGALVVRSWVTGANGESTMAAIGDAGPTKPDDGSTRAMALTMFDAAGLESAIPDASPVAVIIDASVSPGASDTGRPRQQTADRRGSKVPGHVRVLVHPWAEITIDGKSHGQTPKTITLPPGRHKLTLANQEAGKSETIRVRIKSGQTKEIRRTW